MTTTTSGRPAATSSQLDDARALPGARAERVDAAGRGDHLRHPVAAAEERVEPLERGDRGAARRRRSRRGRPRSARSSSSAQPAPGVGDARGLAERDGVVEHLAERRGIEREHPRAGRQPRGDRADVVAGDGADLADLLGDDQVHAELARAARSRARRATRPAPTRSRTAASISAGSRPAGIMLRVSRGSSATAGRGGRTRG